MLGLGTAAGFVLWRLAGLVARRAQAPPAWVFAVVMTLVTSVLGAATVARNATWRDEYTLWLDALEKAPRNARAWLNAGHAAMVRGNDAEARRLLLEAHRLRPCYAYVQMNLSALAVRQGDGDVGLRWADEAGACNAGLALSHHYRGSTLERLGRFDEALVAYRQTTANDPLHADACISAGRLRERNGGWDVSEGSGHGPDEDSHPVGRRHTRVVDGAGLGSVGRPARHGRFRRPARAPVGIALLHRDDRARRRIAQAVDVGHRERRLRTEEQEAVTVGGRLDGHALRNLIRTCRAGGPGGARGAG